MNYCGKKGTFLGYLILKKQKRGFHLKKKVARPVWSFNTMNKNNSWSSSRNSGKESLIHWEKMMTSFLYFFLMKKIFLLCFYLNLSCDCRNYTNSIWTYNCFMENLMSVPKNKRLVDLVIHKKNQFWHLSFLKEDFVFR